jgi:hypothetical protein
MTEDRLRELITDAYGDLHMTRPLSDIEAAARWRPRRRVTAWAAAGTVGVIGAVAFAATPPPPGAVTVAASQTPAASATPGPRCDRVREPLPPLRFTIENLQLYADEQIVAVCHLSNGSPGAVALVTDAQRVQRPGGTASSLLQFGDERIGFAIGPVPAGKTGVEVFFQDGTSATARIENGWYLASGVGADAVPFADVTRIKFTP